MISSATVGITPFHDQELLVEPLMCEDLLLSTLPLSLGEKGFGIATLLVA